MKRNIYLMYTITFLQGMVFYASVSTLYRQVNGITAFEMMVFEAVSFAVSLALELPWGILADRIGYKKTMAVCTVLFALSKVVFWQAVGAGWFLAERILMGVVGAGLSGVDQSILYLSCQEGESQKIFGINRSFGTAGILLSSLIFSVFVGENYRLAAFLTVISYSASAILPFFLTEVKEEKELRFSWTDTKSAFRQVFCSPMLLLFLVSSAILGEMHWVIQGFLNQLQYQRSGMGAKAIALVFVGATVLEFSTAYSDRFTKWAGERKALFLLSGIPMFAAAILALTSLPLLSVICVFTMVLIYSLWSPLIMELQNRQVTGCNRATVLSIYSMVDSSLTAGIDIGIGALADISLGLSFSVVGVLCCISFLVLIVWYQKSLTNQPV